MLFMLQAVGDTHETEGRAGQDSQLMFAVSDLVTNGFCVRVARLPGVAWMQNIDKLHLGKTGFLAESEFRFTVAENSFHQYEQ